MNQACDCQTNAKLNMPFEDLLDKRNVPFIVHLEGNKYSCHSCQKEGHSKQQIPEFPVELK
jgi:hypothetical protein